jgi:hypothetical protein
MSTQAPIGPGRLSVLGREVLTAVADDWWLLLLRGLVAIAFGVIAFFWPALTLVALTTFRARLDRAGGLD